MGYRHFTGIALAAFLLAGCGGSETTAEEQADEQGAERTESATRCRAESNQVPPGTIRDALRTACLAAVEQGRLDDDELSVDDLLTVLRDDPSIFEPVCSENANRGFAYLPDSARQYIDITPEAWGETMCAAIIDGDYFTEEALLPPESMTRLYRDHPELGAPFLFAGLMDGYDESYGIPKATFEKIARRTATEAFSRGLVTALSFSEFDIDDEALRELVAKIAAEYAVE